MQSEIIDLDIDWGPDPIDLAPIFNLHCPLRSARIALYDPSANAFVPLRSLGAENGLFPRRLLEPKVILVRYRPREPRAGCSEESGS